MKNTRLHIPVDICSEILCRLPVKSLLRFRCVSKSWLSLIDNRDFAFLHFKNFNTNDEETHLLVVHDTQRTVVVRCSDTFEISSEPLLTLGRARREGSWDFVCSIDGLVLLKRVFGNGALGFSELKVWNPSIRKFHEFPSLHEIETSPNTYSWDADIGLGYDQLANDYKHVKLIFSNGAWHSVAIYNLGTGSWEINKFEGKGLPGHWDQMSFEQGKKVYLRGSLYILLRDVDNYTDPELVSFDLSSEVVSSIGLPDEPCTYGFEGWKELVLIDDGCSVAVFDCDSIDKSVWVLESSRDGSEFMCWTKRYSFRLKYIHQFLYFKKSGDILTRRCRHETVTDETGKKSSVMWDRVASYNPETEEYKILEERKGSRYLIGHVSAYAESLILLR